MGYMTLRRASRLVPVMVAGAVLCTVPLGGDASSAGEPAFKLLHGFESPPANPRAQVIEGSDGALYGTTYQGGRYNYGIVFKVNRDGTGFVSLLDFDWANGAWPVAGLVEGSDGALYGTTETGGRYGYGLVFKIEPDGTGFGNVHDFFGPDGNGQQLEGRVVEGFDGALYGTTFRGGAHDSGTIFKVNKDGTGFLKLHDFNRSDPGNGTDPLDGLLQGSDGALYGNAAGGAYASGIVYRLNQDGTGFLKLHDFNWADPGGAGPTGELTEGADGALYGTTFIGNGFAGTVFKLNKDGTGFLKLHEFDLENGGYPETGVIEGSDGALYGTTISGGAYKPGGIAFKLERDGSGFSKLHDFGPGYSATHSLAGLVEGSDGMLYGTISDGGQYNWGVAFKLGKDGTGFQSLHDFSPSVGAFLYSKLLQASDGALYGTTYRGGAHGSGTIFKLTSASVGFPFHTFQTLHDFAWNDPANGSYPRAGLIEGSDGVLYGTASEGGAAKVGVIFRIGKDGSGFQKVYDFVVGAGSTPLAPVVEGSDGALYGTTSSRGGVFKVNKDGTGFQNLHWLGDWKEPAGLVEASDGVLYGTTTYGGDNDDGIVFRLRKDGTGFVKLHDFNFADSTNGARPYGELIQASDGALYGTTRTGGASPTYGIIFRIDKNGFLKVYDFGGPEGSAPMAGVIEGPDGALYGTTYSGGPRYYGTVFKVSKDGTGFLTLHGFGRSDGLGPSAALVQGPRGALYGTTYGGGPGGGGVVFSLVMPPTNGNANRVPSTATTPPRP